MGTVLALLTLGTARAALPGFDFTSETDRQGWVAQNDLSSPVGTTEGLRLTITGGDPFLSGPRRDFPSGQPLWLRLKLRSSQGGSCQVFYYTTNPTEPASVRFTAPAGQWVEGRVPLPALGPGFRFRIDPPGISGVCTLASLQFEERSALPDFDFRTVPDATEWQPDHDLAGLDPTPEGLRARISGGDPYFHGPVRSYPTDAPLWMHVRLKSTAGGMAQVFYFRTGATEEQSVRFFVPAGDWQEIKVRMPALGSGYRLRFDPPGSEGECLLQRLWFSPRLSFAAPAWPTPERPAVGGDAVELVSGDLQLRHGRSALGAFELRVGDRLMAVGHAQGLLGYVQGAQARWVPLGHGSGSKVQVELQPRMALGDRTIGGVVRAKAALTDPDGAEWQVEQTFAPGQPGTFEVTTQVSVSQDREVLYLPMLTLLAGLGNYGTNKTQALLAGVEYLENEPSSSTADLNPPASNRQIIESAKLTFPLAALAAEGRYLGLIWNRHQREVAVVFDSPDRFFNSGGSLMGLLVPGSDGLNREESSLIPYDTLRLKADRRLSVATLVVGGVGETVIPAVQDYVRLYGWPPLPSPGLTDVDFDRLMAKGWLDSEIRQGDLYRHAAGGNFGSMPAADAALYLEYLAPRLDDAALTARARAASAATLALVPSQNYNGNQVGHVRYPAPALVFGAPILNANLSTQHGQSLLHRFQPDGSVRYQKPADGLDYGRTHWAPDANGLTAQVVAALLEDAVFSGNRALVQSGLKYLRALDKFRGTVPRGAQTWEIPLHTPDILASAYLVRAYTLGYELTRDPDFLAQAQYWAWTGVPFVYLSPPAPQLTVGLYSTTPVLGATAWVAPVWIGLPVQWCGLVYADALHRLQPHDPTGPWKHLADGITLSGIQQSYPATDARFRGLLPDSYALLAQTRNGPNINPATLLAPASRLLGEPPIYAFASLPKHGLFVHAPGRVSAVTERTDGVGFRVEGWPARDYWVLVTGLSQRPTLQLNGQTVPLTAPHEYDAANGRLAIRAQGAVDVALTHTALAVLWYQVPEPGGTLRLLWPARLATNLGLVETSPSIAGADWTTLNLPVARLGDSWYVTEALGASDRFYRLRLMSP